MPEKFRQHRHFTRQIAFSRNQVVPILPESCYPNFLCSHELNPGLILKFLKKLRDENVTCISISKYFFPLLPHENSGLPVKTGVVPFFFFSFTFTRTKVGAGLRQWHCTAERKVGQAVS